VMKGYGFAPDIAFFMMAKKLNFSLIWPENHLPFVWGVSHMPLANTKCVWLFLNFLWSRQRRWLWTAGKRGPSMPHSHRRGCSGAGWELQSPWCPHHQRTNMVQTHRDSCESGTTKPIPPQETEKIWHGSSDPQKILQLHHREHWLHHCLVWQLLVLRPHCTQTVEWMAQTSIPGGVRGRPWTFSKTPATLVIDCSLCYHTVSGTGAPILGPRGF
jgi:hypothetical protein